jgi:hypothetical protein
MAQMTEQSRRESRERSNMGIGQRAAFDARKKQEQNASPKKEDVPAAPNPYELETARIAAAQKARFDQPAAGADIRESQTRLAKMLEDQASGKSPSVAEAQMRQAMDRSIAGQQASLAGARGIDPGLAMRMMARQGAEQRAELGQAAGIARLQEQQGAQQQLAGALQATRTSDLAAQQLADATAQFYEAQRTGNFQAMKDAELQIQSMKAAAAAARQQRETNILGGLIQAGATMAGGYFGGPAGAAAGSAAGGAVAGSVAK